MMRSLRRRAIIGALVWAALSATVAFFALVALFDAQSQRHFDEHLREEHQSLVVALGNSNGDPEVIEVLMSNPEYGRTFSGSYWQVVGPEGMVYTSRSLFDSTLHMASEPGPEPGFWVGAGPEGQVRGLAQQITSPDGKVWNITVAQSLNDLVAEREQTWRSLAGAFIVVGGLSVIGAFLLVSSALRPLNQLREEVAHRWDSGEALNPEAYPEEVVPLVEDINLLIARNRKVIDGARRQAADLAHALKTPTAILRNEIERREEEGGFLEAREALERIDAQLLRSLARIRAGNSAVAGYRTDLRASAERLARLFRRAPGAEDLDLQIDVSTDLTVAMDRQDIEEVLGNLIDNALKWRKKTVRMAAGRSAGNVVVVIEDDGPGIPDDRRAEALRAGGRLDTSAAGTGLGLSIAADLVAAYDGEIALESSRLLGGLRVRITLPEMRALMERRAVEEDAV